MLQLLDADDERAAVVAQSSRHRADIGMVQGIAPLRSLVLARVGKAPVMCVESVRRAKVVELPARLVYVQAARPAD